MRCSGTPQSPRTDPLRRLPAIAKRIFALDVPRIVFVMAGLVLAISVLLEVPSQNVKVHGRDKPAQACPRQVEIKSSGVN